MIAVSDERRRLGRAARALIAIAVALAVVLAFGAASAFGAFNYESATIGVGSLQEAPASAGNPADRLKLPTQSISAADDTAALATPTEQTAVTKVEEQAPTASAAAASTASTATASTPAASTAASASAPAASTAAPAATEQSSAQSSDAYGEWNSARASWYYDEGSTASGEHNYYGIAHKTLPFGTEVEIEYNGNTIIAVVDDRGPYVSGRSFDLNQNCAAALGFGGVGTINYRIKY